MSIAEVVTGKDWCVPTAFAAALGLEDTTEVADLIRAECEKGKGKDYVEDKYGNIAGMYNRGVYKLAEMFGVVGYYREYAMRGWGVVGRPKRLVSNFLKVEKKGVWVVSVRDGNNNAHALCVDLNEGMVLDSFATNRVKLPLESKVVKNYLRGKRLFFVVRVSE